MDRSWTFLPAMLGICVGLAACQSSIDREALTRSVNDQVQKDQAQVADNVTRYLEESGVPANLDPTVLGPEDGGGCEEAEDENQWECVAHIDLGDGTGTRIIVHYDVTVDSEECWKAEATNFSYDTNGSGGELIPAREMFHDLSACL